MCAHVHTFVVRLKQKTANGLPFTNCIFRCICGEYEYMRLTGTTLAKQSNTVMKVQCISHASLTTVIQTAEKKY